MCGAASVPCADAWAGRNAARVEGEAERDDRNAAPASRVYALAVFAPFLLVLAAPKYRIVDLGVPPGAEEVRATAINNRGEVLVVAGTHGYLWRSGSFLYFGEPVRSHMTGDPGSTDPRALNDSGVVVGAQGGFGPVFMSGYVDADAFIWRGKKMENPGIGNTSQANGINNLGDVIGDDGHGAFARLGGKVVGLPKASHVEPSDPSGEMGDVNQSNGIAINDRRQILMNSTYGGKHGETNMPSRPFLLDGTKRPLRMVPVPLPKGVTEAVGLDLNARGDVLATAVFGDRRFVPYLVVRGAITMLSYPEGVALSGKLNRRGDVAGTATLTYEPTQTFAPVLWLHRRRVAFPQFPGWTLQTSTGINDKGAICGTGLHDGKVRAYVLNPD